MRFLLADDAGAGKTIMAGLLVRELKLREFQESIKDPARFPWHEVTKVAHYYLEVNALKQPMEVRKISGSYDQKSEP